MAANSISFLFKDSLSSTLRFSHISFHRLVFAHLRYNKGGTKPSLLRCLFFSFQSPSVTETEAWRLDVWCQNAPRELNQIVSQHSFDWWSDWEDFTLFQAAQKPKLWVTQSGWEQSSHTNTASLGEKRDKHLRISWKGNSQMFPPRCPSEEESRIHSILFRV